MSIMVIYTLDVCLESLKTATYIRRHSQSLQLLRGTSAILLTESFLILRKWQKLH